jgi:hypothetical protein
MKQFKIRENGFKEIRKQTLVRTIPLLTIAAIGGLLISEFNPAYDNISDINVLPYVIAILIGTLVIGLSIGIKRQKAIYDKYELILDENSITREQGNTSTIRILFTDIKKITKDSNGGLIINGLKLSNTILVPAQIDDMASLENILQAKCSTQISMSKPLMQRLIIPLVLVLLGLMVTTYISTNKILVSVFGSIVIAVMIMSFIKIQTIKNIDSKTRRSSYWILFVIISIVGVIINKLMN